MTIFQERLAALDEVIKKERNSAEAYYNRAKYVFDNIASMPFETLENGLDYTNQMEDDLVRAILYNSEFADAYYLKGLVHKASDELFDAKENFELAIEFNDEHSGAIYELARLIYEQEINEYMPDEKPNYSQAIFHLDYIIDELDLGLGKVYLLRAQLCGLYDDEEKMNSDYKEAFKLMPNSHADIYYARGDMHLRLKEYDKALIDVNEAIKLNPSAEFRMGKVKILEALGETDEANELRISLTAEKAYCNDADFCGTAYFDRGFTQHNTGNYENALSDYSKALEYDPSRVSVLLHRSLICKIMGNYDDAMSDLCRILEIESLGSPSDVGIKARREMVEVYKILGVKYTWWDRLKSYF